MEYTNELNALPIDKQVTAPVDPNKSEVILPDVVDKSTGQLSQGVNLPDQISPLGAIHRKAMTLDPKATAEKIRIAQMLNEPEVFVDKNFEQLKKLDFNKNDAYWNKFQEDHPQSAEFLKNPANMAVVHDDIDNLAQHEQLVNGVKSANGYLDDIKAGFQSSSVGLVSRMKAPDMVESENASASHRLLSQAVGLALDLPIMTVGGVAGGLAGGTAGLTAGAAAGTVVPGAGNIVAAAAAGSAGAAGGAAAGSFAAPGMLKNYLLQKFKQGEVNSVSDFFQRPVDYGEVLKEGLKQSAVGLATLGAGELAKPIAEVGGKYVGGLIEKGINVAAPLVSEVGAMTVTGNAVEGKETKAQDFLDGLLLVGAMHGSTSLAEHGIELYRTKQAKDFYSALGDSAGASKLRERLPEKYKEQVATLTKDGPVENVFVPVKAMDEYFQSKNIDPEALSKELGIENEYKEAQETGGDVKIPLANYVDKIVGTDHYKALADDIKFSLEARTVNESKQFDAELKDQLTAVDQVALKKAMESEKTKAEAEQVRSDVYDQLIKTGMDKDTAKTNAELFKKVAVVAASKQELSPMEWFKNKGLEITGGESSDNAQSFAQSKERRDAGVQVEQMHVPLPENINTSKINNSLSYDLNKGIGERVSSMLAPREVTNDHSGEQIKISENTAGKLISEVGKRKLSSKSTAQDLVRVLGNIDDVVKNAVYLEKSEDTKSKGRAFDYYYSHIDLNGKDAVVQLQVDSKNGNELYNVKIQKINKERGVTSAEASSLVSESSPTKLPLSSISLSDFQSKINTARENEYFQARKKGPAQELFKGKEFKDLEFSDGNYHRENTPSYEFNLKGPALKRADKAGFDTQNTWFHGTKANIESFSSDTLGGSTGAGSAKLAHFFASSPSTASDYASASSAEYELRYKRERGELERRLEQVDGKSKKTKSDKEQIKSIKDNIAKLEEDHFKLLDTKEKVRRSDINFKKESLEAHIANLEEQIKTGASRDDKRIENLKSLIANNERVLKGEWVKDPAHGFSVIGEDGKKIPNPIYKSVDDLPSFIEGADKRDAALHRFSLSKDSVESQTEKYKKILSGLESDSYQEQLDNAKKELADVNEKIKISNDGEGGDVVYPTLLKMNNPLVVDFKDSGYREVTYREILEKAQAAGYDGVIFKNTYDPAFAGGGANHELIDVAAVFEPNQIRSVFAQFKDLNSSNILFQNKAEENRGSIQFKEEKTVITLMNSADKSTFLHEMGHLFFEDFYNHAMSGDASVKHMNDWKVLADHIGYDPEQESLTVDQHEKLARTFEAYLMDGKAPVKGLQRVFTVLRRWMTNVYRSMNSLGVEISPEVRDVMDRMVATEDEIAIAKKKQGLDLKIDVNDLPSNVKEKLTDLERQSEERAFAKMMKDQMREISADNKQFLLDKEKELSKKFTEEIKKSDEGIKVLDLRDALKKKDIWTEAENFLGEKMSEEKRAQFEATAEDMGYTSGDHMARDIKETPSIESLASERVQAEMKNFTGLTDKEVVRQKAMQVIHNEKSVELLALQKEILFEKVTSESEKELSKIADAMEKDNTKLIQEWLIAKEVHKVTGKFNEKLQQQSARFGKELSRLEERASSFREKTKQKELAHKWLDAKDASERKQAESEFRESIKRLKEELTRNSSDEADRVNSLAKDMLAKQTFRDARKFTSYFTGERNSALRVAKAVSENNWRGALEAKHEQMLNHALAKEAIRIGKKVDSQIKYLDKMQKLRKDLWKNEDHFNQAANILGRFGFERKDYDPSLKRETLTEWSNRQAENGNEVNIAPWILDENIKLDQSTITTEQLTDIRNAIKNIQFITNTENNQSLLDSKLSTEEVTRALIVESMANVKLGDRIVPKMEDTKVDKLKSFARSYMFSLKRIESVIGTLGGWREDSKFTKVFVDSVYEAANKESDIRREAAKQLESSWSIYSKEERKDIFNKKKFIPEFNTSISKDRLIAMALNIGNEENKTKLFETKPVGMDVSLPWSEAVGMKILQRELNAKDWKFVQSTWDHINSYWPDMAELHRKMTGFTPGKVEAKKFTVQAENGPVEMEGGYYPLKSDSRNSFKEELKNNADNPLYTEQTPSWKAATKTGHTKERTQAKYPLSLDLGVINRHLNDVIHDISFRETVRDMSRIISREEFQSEIKSTSGAEGYKAFKEYLGAIAGNSAGEPATAIDRVLKAMRMNTTTATLFFKLGVAAKHIPNMLMAPNAVEGFGYKDTLEAYAKYGTLKYAIDGLTGDTVETRKMIHDKSAFMRDLYDSPEYSIEKTHNKFSKNDESEIAHFAHGMITKANAFVTEPIWMGGYNKAIAEGKSEAEAIKQGDLLAKRVMGSSRKYDVAPIMRGTELQKMFAMFFGPVNNIHNRWMRENGIIQRDKDVSRALGFLTMSIGMQVMGSALMLKTPKWDDDKEVKEWLFANSAELPLEFFPGFRDVADQVAKRTLGLQTFGYMPSPAFSGIEYGLKGVDAARSLVTGKAKPMDAAEKISKAASFNLGYPDFFNQAFFNLYDYSNGMKPELKDIYRRRTKKER